MTFWSILGWLLFVGFLNLVIGFCLGAYFQKETEKKTKDVLDEKILSGQNRS